MQSYFVETLQHKNNERCNMLFMCMLLFKVLVTVWWQIRRPKLLVWLLRASCSYFIQSSKPSNSWIRCAFGMVFPFLGTTLLWRAFLEQRSQKELLSFLLSSSGFTALVSKSNHKKKKRTKKRQPTFLFSGVYASLPWLGRLRPRRSTCNV